MTIYLRPTIASITGSQLPENIIDGKNIWEVLTGKTTESPHEAYFFYFNVNELHGIRYKNWKMYYPRAYKSLNGGLGDKSGFPVDYDFNTVAKIQLFDLSTDMGEEHDLADKYPNIIMKMDSFSNKMRIRLGDSFHGIVGEENREVGIIN